MLPATCDLTVMKVQFPGEKSSMLSDVDKINIIEVGDSESDLGLPGKALVSENITSLENYYSF